MINFYGDMWYHRSELVASLSALENSKKFQWKEEHQQAFEALKKKLSKNVLLTYPDFSKIFEVHTDASDIQMGALITKDKKPLAFYSRRLNPAQQCYTVSERELLSLVETFKAYRNILLGQPITAYTDRLNITHK